MSILSAVKNELRETIFSRPANVQFDPILKKGVSRMMDRMTDQILRYLPYVNRQTLTVIYILLALIALAVAGGAPSGSFGSIG